MANFDWYSIKQNTKNTKSSIKMNSQQSVRNSNYSFLNLLEKSILSDKLYVVSEISRQCAGKNC